jgi:hypothetical protein
MRPHFGQTRFFPLAEGASTPPSQKGQREPSCAISFFAGSFSGIGIPGAKDGQDCSARGRLRASARWRGIPGTAASFCARELNFFEMPRSARVGALEKASPAREPAFPLPGPALPFAFCAGVRSKLPATGNAASRLEPRKRPETHASTWASVGIFFGGSFRLPRGNLR